MKEFSPLEMLERLIKNWWLIALLAVGGGLLGWLSSTILPQTFEARAEFYVSLDEAQLAYELKTEELTLLMKEDVLGPLEDFFFSEDVLNSVALAARDLDDDLGIQNFRRDFSLYRIHTSWFLVARYADSQIAIDLVNLWAESADQFLQEAIAHAIDANDLELQLNLILQCFNENDFQDANPCAGTSFGDQEMLDAHLVDLYQMIETERDASMGLHHTLDIEFTTPANSAELILYPRGWLILAGVFIGSVVGVALSRGGKRK
jgi:hypothetical protein